MKSSDFSPLLDSQNQVFLLLQSWGPTIGIHIVTSMWWQCPTVLLRSQLARIRASAPGSCYSRSWTFSIQPHFTRQMEDSSHSVAVRAPTSELQWSPLFMNPTIYSLQWCQDDRVPSALLFFQLHYKVILHSLNWVRAMLSIKIKPPLSRKYTQSHIIGKILLSIVGKNQKFSAQ